MEKFAEVFGTFILGVIGAILAIVLNGYVLAKLWMWFIVPTFNVNPLRIIECLGIAMLIHYVIPLKSDGDKTFVVKLIEGVLLALFTLGIGWILVQFM